MRTWFFLSVFFSTVSGARAADPTVLPGMERTSPAARSSCRETFERDRKKLLQNPEDEKAWTALRICATELKRWNEAAEAGRAAIQKGSRQPGPHVLLGVAGLRLKDYQKAADELEEAIGLKPDQPAAYYYLGIAYLFLHQPGQAARAAERAVELDPENANNHSQLAYAYLLLDERKKGEQAAQKAIRLDPDNVTAYKVLGSLYAKEGRREESDKAFEEAIHANGRAAGIAPARKPSGIVPIAPPSLAPLESAQETVPPETICAQQWSKLKAAMIKGDTAEALAYLSNYLDTRDQYRRAFERMGTRSRDVFAGLGELTDCQTVLASVACKARVLGPRGQTHETTVRCERNPDKTWRIRSF